jgi:hypothetical protein
VGTVTTVCTMGGNRDRLPDNVRLLLVVQWRWLGYSKWWTGHGLSTCTASHVSSMRCRDGRGLSAMIPEGMGRMPLLTFASRPPDRRLPRYTTRWMRDDTPAVRSHTTSARWRGREGSNEEEGREKSSPPPLQLTSTSSDLDAFGPPARLCSTVHNVTKAQTAAVLSVNCRGGGELFSLPSWTISARQRGGKEWTLSRADIVSALYTSITDLAEVLR